MSLPHALMTALAEKPCSGSELARRFDRSIGYFWQATHQQIYRELARLEAAEWIGALPKEGGRGRRRSYQLLPKGREELARWVGSSLEPTPVREALGVRLRAEAVVGPTGLLQELRTLLVCHQQKLDTYLEIEQRAFQAEPLQKAQHLRYLVLRAGIRYEQQHMEFLREAIELLEQDL